MACEKTSSGWRQLRVADSPVERIRRSISPYTPSHRPGSCEQRPDPVAEWATSVSFGSQLYQNIVYQKANGLELKLDVITKGSQPRPVVIFFHGGGWVQGKKENHLLSCFPTWLMA